MVGVALGAEMVLATGQLRLPQQPGTYTVSLANGFAGVLRAGGVGPVWAVDVAAAEVAGSSFTVIVSANSASQLQVEAGADVAVYEGLGVHLQAVVGNPDNDLLTYAWTQTAGLAVTPVGADGADLTFEAPAVGTVDEASMAFAVGVSDLCAGQASDGVSVRVYMLGDATHDDSVDVQDLISLGAAWDSSVGQENYDPSCDFNRDGAVDVVDLMILGENWERTLLAAQGQMRSMAGWVMASGMEAEGTVGAGEMSLYEALDLVGLLEVYLDCVSEY